MGTLKFVRVLAAALTLGFTLSAQSKDPWIGDWKLNVSKSTYYPGPPPQSQSVKVEPLEGVIRYVFDGITGQGAKRHFEYSAKFDGKYRPVQGNQDVDAVAFKLTGERSYKQLNKKDGNIFVAISTFSADGKVWTQAATGKDAQGRPFKNTQVRERQ